MLGGVGVAGTVVDGPAMHRVEVGTLESLAGPCCDQALVEQARAELGHHEGDHELGIRVDGTLAGIAVVGETALESNESAIDALGGLDIRVSVFSGDSNHHRLGRLPADDVRGAMTPAAKAAAVRRFTEEGRKSPLRGRRRERRVRDGGGPCLRGSGDGFHPRCGNRGYSLDQPGSDGHSRRDSMCAGRPSNCSDRTCDSRWATICSA